MRRVVPLILVAALGAAGCGGDSSNEPHTSSDVPFDQAFIDAMVPHHQEAIEMAEAAQSRGLSAPELEQIAGDIIASQQAEIEQLLDWREEWFGSRALGPIVPEVLGVDSEEMGMGHGSGDELLNSADIDATFAAMMVPHHEGAISMAELAEERAQHDEIEDLAADIIEAQEREVDILEEHVSAEHHG